MVAQKHPSRSRSASSSSANRERQLQQLTTDVAARLAHLSSAGFAKCVEQVLSKTYTPVEHPTELSVSRAETGSAIVHAYRNKYPVDANVERPVLVLVTEDPKKVSRELVHRLRSAVQHIQGSVGFIFCQRRIVNSFLKWADEEQDQSVQIISTQGLAKIMVERGVGVRLWPNRSKSAPQWTINDRFFRDLDPLNNPAMHG